MRLSSIVKLYWYGVLTSTLPDVEEAGPVGRHGKPAPEGGPVVVRHRDCGEPVHVELRCVHDHRVFEVEETKSTPRPGLTDL